ncbi:hypothetical protein CPB84DRAFT_1772025 [Gymnopilus junonius]|uniref:Uncharacterized protein n=1 Tax=Gymnopilus junonius TaxID=109634 RepID=A0A9P5TPP1_GYMJU|nr:hypothetical protein CPB84DRAFT_1772025 [Gymnopilus junonius]
MRRLYTQSASPRLLHFVHNEMSQSNLIPQRDPSVTVETDLWQNVDEGPYDTSRP